QRAGRVGETAGSIRAGGHAAPGPRPRAPHLQAVVTGAAPRAGDARPGKLLARRLCRGAQGPARALPEALLARESARGAAHTRRAWVQSRSQVTDFGGGHSRRTIAAFI